MDEILNILIAGHRPNRLPQEPGLQDETRTGLRKALDAFTRFADKDHLKLRIITGDTDGSDEWARALAREGALELYIAGACRPEDEPQVSQPGFWLTNAPDDGLVDSRHYAAINDAKLFYADVLLIVWDGDPPAGTSAGAVRLLIEAVHQRKPVLWVDARPNSAGCLHWIDFSGLDGHTIALVDAHEGNVQELHALFRELPREVGALAEPIGISLESYLYPQAATAFDGLVKSWDPGEGRIWAGWLHSAFLRLFGYPRLEGGRYTSYMVAGFEPKDAPFWDAYHALDRAAVKASNVHRDQVVATHLFAALAVFMAIAGGIGLGAAWGIAEFAVLAGILWIVWHDRKRGATAHKAYLSLRHGAETFRTLGLLRPFLASLSRIERDQWASAKAGNALLTPQTWCVLKRFRSEGPPRAKVPGQGYAVANDLGQLQNSLIEFIEDQRRYHEKTHERWHEIHHRIEVAMKIIFGLAMATALAHLFALGIHFSEHHDWYLPKVFIALGHGIHEYSMYLLFFTAFGPALAASLHGITGKLEVARLATHSNTMMKKLADLKEAVKEVDTSIKSNLLCLRALALQTANTIYAEHEAWVELLHGQDLDIPA